MVDNVKLEVEERSEKGTTACRRLRRSGRVPLNLYGLDRPPRPLSASEHEVEMIVERGHHIVELTSGDDSQVVLVKDVQFDSIGSKVLHADMIRIDRNTPVHVFVPIRYIGMAPEVSGSIVEKILEDVQVEVLPLRIPREFVINLSELPVGEHRSIKDLDMPEGCTPYHHHPDDTVVTNHMKAHRQLLEEADEAPQSGAEESVEPEVIGKEPKGEGDE